MNCRSFSFLPNRLIALLVIICCLENVSAQNLNFQTTAPAYPAGGTSNSYTNIGNPAVNVGVVITASGGGAYQLGTPKASSTGLQLTLNFNANTDTRTVTITFSQGVSDLNFRIYGISTTTQYQDKVTITATRNNGQVAVNPILTPSAYASVSGNSLLGTGTDPGSAASQVRFTDFVQKLTIVYGNGPNARTNPGLQGITIGNLNWAAPLPVTLLSFTAKPESDRVQLAWATTMERDADRFVVEHSTDLGEYTTVGEVTAKGTTDERQYYGLTDLNPRSGINYYRLKQIDFDGTVHEFKPVSAIIRADEPVIDLFPNPVDPNRIHLRLWNTDAPTIRVLNSLGHPVNGRLERQPGAAELLFDQPLPPGLYWVEIQADSRKNVIKALVR